MRQKSFVRAAVLATVLAFGAVAVAPIAPAHADGIEGIRGGAKKKPAPKRKPKPAPVQKAPQPAPAPVIVPSGPQELTLPSSFFEGSGGVGVNITGGAYGGGGVVIVTHGGGATYSGFASRPAFFTGGGKGC